MKIPVLMYHDITESGDPDDLTIRKQQLKQQLLYIKKKGYQTISLRQFYCYLTQGKALPPKPVLISFDDGFKSNFYYLYPLLMEHNMQAAIFLVASFIETKENNSGATYLHVDHIRQMNPAFVDYGCHSYQHKSYTGLALPEIETDLQKMQARFDELNIDVVPLFAYPFGASPRKENEKMSRFKAVISALYIAGAFRIGNRINPAAIENYFQIQRIDVKGTDPFWKFKLMLRFGKKWLP